MISVPLQWGVRKKPSGNRLTQTYLESALYTEAMVMVTAVTVLTMKPRLIV